MVAWRRKVAEQRSPANDVDDEEILLYCDADDARASSSTMSTPAAMPAMEGVAPELLPDKDKIYFNDYATLVQQQGMLQDSVRTSIYQFAVLENRSDFEGKRVMDVGAGTGILSFFAARGGASTVYAVEASLMAHKAEKLAAANGLGGVVKVLNQRVEEVSLDAKVDVLISEPLGIALVNERMLESYIAARDAHLKPGGKMFPDRCVMYAAPFSDEALYSEQLAKTAFWCQSNFYGVDLNSLRDDAQQFYFSQPVVGPVNPASLVSTAAQHVVDLSTITLAELTNFTIPFDYGIELITQACRAAPSSRAILAQFWRNSLTPPPPSPRHRSTASRCGSTAASRARRARSSSRRRRTSR